MITGSASGIGEAMAYRFAEAGSDLILIDMNERALKTVKSNLSSYDVKIDLKCIDLSRKDEIDDAWEKLAGNEPDVLVNNAGIYPLKEFLEVEESFFNLVMNTNLNSVFWMCQNMIRARGKRGGNIINIGSIEAIMPFKEDMAHYDISKAGVLAMTRALAKDFGKHGFRINAIIPGGIMTSGIKRTARQILRLKLGLIKSGIEFRSRLPLGRFGQPDEIACMALVLASDLSSYVHGAIVPVDGGFLSS